MDDLLRRRRPPFIIVAVVALVLAVAILRLPESLLVQLENSSPLSVSQRIWLIRLLGIFAFLQALYVGLSVLRVETVRQARMDERYAAMPFDRLVGALARNSGFAIWLTIFYGLVGLALTGNRGAFWLFVAISVLQMGWYYRQTGEIARWLALQTQPDALVAPLSIWEREPDDYTPPLLRGMKPVEPRSS
jgi:hypothetical protein